MSDAGIATIGPQCIEGIYLIADQVALPDWIDPPSEDVKPAGFEGVTHTFTDDVNRAPHIRDELIARIAGARTKVFFCSFIFADVAIVSALCEAAARLHGGVYVLTALEKDMKPDLSDYAEDDPTERAKRERLRRDQHMESLQRLARAGAWMRGAADCHAKFCVVDDEVAVVTSANATGEAYARNPENGAIVSLPGVARELGRLFAHFWLERTSSESLPGAELNVRNLPRRTTPSPTWVALVRPARVRPICTLGAKERSLLTRTVALLDGAMRELAVVVYSVVALEKHAVGAAIRRALLRGVSLVLVVRTRNHADEQRRALAWLVDGIPQDRWCIRGHPLNHAKAIVADGARALLWTGNLDGHHGYEDGFEVGLEVDAEPFAAHVRKYIMSLAVRSPATARLRPTLTELAGLGGAAPLSGEWALRVPARLRSSIPRDLLQRLSSDTVLFAGVGGRFELRVGGRLAFRGHRDDAARTLAVEEVPRPGRESRENMRFGYVGACTMKVIFEPVTDGHSRRDGTDTNVWRRR